MGRERGERRQRQRQSAMHCANWICNAFPFPRTVNEASKRRYGHFVNTTPLHNAVCYVMRGRGGLFRVKGGWRWSLRVVAAHVWFIPVGLPCALCSLWTFQSEETCSESNNNRYYIVITQMEWCVVFGNRTQAGSVMLSSDPTESPPLESRHRWWWRKELRVETTTDIAE